MHSPHVHALIYTHYTCQLSHALKRTILHVHALAQTHSTCAPSGQVRTLHVNALARTRGKCMLSRAYIRPRTCIRCTRDHIRHVVYVCACARVCVCVCVCVCVHCVSTCNLVWKRLHGGAVYRPVNLSCRLRPTNGPDHGTVGLRTRV